MTSDNQLDFSVFDGELFMCIETCFDLETSRFQFMCGLFQGNFSCEQRKSATANLFTDSCSFLIVMKVPFKKSKNNNTEKFGKILKKGKNENSVKTRRGFYMETITII